MVHLNTLRQESKEGTGSDSGADDTSDVRTHGMHEQEVMAVVLQTEVVTDTCSHRNSRHACITDQGVQFLTLWLEEVHNLHKAYTRGGGNHEGHGAKCEDLDGVECQEL